MTGPAAIAPGISVGVAVAQWAPGPDKATNLAEVNRFAAEAAAGGASTVVLPENVMYTNRVEKFEPADIAEPLDGFFATGLCAVAAEHRITVVAGLTEVGEEKPYNTVLVADPEVGVVGRYRKTHLYDAFAYRESDQIAQAPAEPLVFDLGGLAVGVMTCYDLRFPEFARFLVDAGAQVLVVPSAWATGPTKVAHWNALLAARAIENVSYVVAAGQTGPHCIGLSSVLSPGGTVVAAAGTEPGLAMATIHSDELNSARLVNPSLSNRRFSVVPRDPHLPSD